MSNPELALLIAVPIVAATLPLLAGLKFEAVGWPIAALTAAVELALAGSVVRRVVAEGRFVHNLGGYPRTYGIELVVDEFSAVVISLIAVVTLVVVAYARRGGPRENAFYSAFLLLLGGLMGVGLTGDVFNMFVFLEIVGLATYALVAADRSARAALASLKYLIVGTAGASLYLVGVGFLLVATGTLNMTDLAATIPETVGYTDPLIVASFCFVAVGLSVKAAIFPLHTWISDAYAESPDTVTAYISGLASTLGAYALARLVYVVYTPAFFEAVPLAGDALVAFATVSIVAGSVLAVIQSDVKRMLAYSSVAQFGMIVAAFGLATEQALVGGIVHLVGHGLMKTALFLGVGVIASAYGIRTVRQYANLGYRSPVAVAAIAALLLGLVGVPPSIGFLGKWYIAWGAIEAGAPIVAAVVLFSTLLTLLYVARLLETMYFQPADDIEGAVTADGRGVRLLSDGGSGDDGDERPVSFGMVFVVAALSVAAVALGFAGPVFEAFLDPFLEAVL
ncbi:MAG: proton-conducting transporter membrane subunit [Natronomonas sp.]|uniref:proton-conducting transporter transmembrane domain-containing protein n=1 Tax=Natronomonas sp. TaxID=2184060 RepID=UPI0028701D80|nr:proton-conducting transporter membrane subunit [Natronomonas sp.]MDR9431487.1 proton-conducting transporter membrane subunit [Natronomonas sp.]